MSSLQRRNVLTLDGGGVRGLASLFILQRLMQQINSAIEILSANEHGPARTHREVQPQEIFDLVAGTSTGGLIAIMLGKLGMSVRECIETYQDLSRMIFIKGHFRGKLVGGLGPARYKGSRLRELVRNIIEERANNPNLPMKHQDEHQDEQADRRGLMACAVVCREHMDDSKFSEYKPDPVCICSHRPCPAPLDCMVCDAARATSAAPTYFAAQKINNRYFVDGGMEYNNPSFAIFSHYAEPIFAESALRTSFSNLSASTAAHSSFDFSKVRIVNIGTGTRSKDVHPRRRDALARLVPTPIRMGIFLKTTLTQFAVESEKTANQMRSLAQVSGEVLGLKWERFSPTNRICHIKLDKYKQLTQIEVLTREYLDMEDTQRKLRRVGEEIAREYLARQHRGPGQAAASPALTVPSTVRSQGLQTNVQNRPAPTKDSASRRPPQINPSFPPSSSESRPTPALEIQASAISDSSGNGCSDSTRGTTPGSTDGPVHALDEPKPAAPLEAAENQPPGQLATGASELGANAMTPA